VSVWSKNEGRGEGGSRFTAENVEIVDTSLKIALMEAIVVVAVNARVNCETAILIQHAKKNLSNRPFQMFITKLIHNKLVQTSHTHTRTHTH
jgi:hypothetical protein